MGYQLYREIKNHAPEDWSAGERLVALIIADSAQDKTRRTRMPLYELMEQSGYSDRMIRKLLQKLADRGFEFRVSHGTKSNGRPLYTCKRVAVSYQVPHMVIGGTRLPPMPLPVPVDNSPNGGTPVPPTDPNGGTPVPPTDPNGGTPVPEWRHSGAAPYPLQPLTPGVPVVGGAVEVASGPRGQEQIGGSEVAAGPGEVRRRKMSSIEYAAWQAAESRRTRLAAEQEIRKHQQKEENDGLPHHVRLCRPVRDPGERRAGRRLRRWPAVAVAGRGLVDVPPRRAGPHQRDRRPVARR